MIFGRQGGPPSRPQIVELERKVSPPGGGKISEQEQRITPLSRAELEKYMYAKAEAEESKEELSTPGRITNPDNVSECSAPVDTS